MWRIYIGTTERNYWNINCTNSFTFVEPDKQTRSRLHVVWRNEHLPKIHHKSRSQVRTWINFISFLMLSVTNTDNFIVYLVFFYSHVHLNYLF